MSGRLNEVVMKAETQEAAQPEASFEVKSGEPAAEPQLVLLAADDATVGVCNLAGACS